MHWLHFCIIRRYAQLFLKVRKLVSLCPRLKSKCVWLGVVTFDFGGPLEHHCEALEGAAGLSRR